MKNVTLTPHSVGSHIIADLYGIKDLKNLDSLEDFERILKTAAKEANMKVIGETWNKFEPQGLTGCLLISESHFTVHTWPEFEFISVDIYSCGNEGDVNVAFESLKRQLNPDMNRSVVQHIDRSIYPK